MKYLVGAFIALAVWKALNTVVAWARLGTTTTWSKIHVTVEALLMVGFALLALAVY